VRHETGNPLGVFIEGWGRMGNAWGVGKVMGEIHALLYLSSRPLSLEEMSDLLKTSRSNISLNVRGLLDLGVVKKVIIRGDRKDYYTAETDMGRVARRLAAAKKKRELDPAIEMVDRAIRAAEISVQQPAGDDTLPAIDPARLRALRDLMESIAGIFDGFIHQDARRVEAVETQNV
jgi:DNA-binding transcriptional regulator GbsR (MarR family)